MIAIATGIDALDQRIKQKFEENNIKDFMIVNYREFLLKSNFDVVIISKKLIGNIELEYLILTLREKDIRIMYLTNKDAVGEIRLCFKYGINDILTDPIDAELVVNVYKEPKKFSDVKKLFLMVNSKNATDKTVDFDRLMEISEEQNRIKPTIDTKGSNSKKEVKYEVKKEIKKEKEVKEYERILRMKEEQEIEEEPVHIPETVVKTVEKEKHFAGKEDLSRYNKKEVIRETIQETVYRVPSDYKKVIVILGTEPTGKTTIAVNMAWCFSQQHIKTILIDTDFKKKDVYFHFDKNFSNCLNRLAEEENVINLGIDVNPNLKIFTENKDCEVEFGQYDIMKLIVSAKNHAQVVIIDLSHDLDEDTVRNILEIADNSIVVVDQKVTTLNRVPEDLAKFRGQLHNMSIIINRYYPLRHLESDEIKSKFFEDVDLPSGKEFNYIVDKVHTVSDDAKSVLQGLANRIPAMELKNNFIADDIKKICKYYYVAKDMQQKKKGFMFFK
ncbi:MAG TPA: hypothetical protein DEP72_01135 [Clostridiales bacterium]|nr:MAG: hypothetical protein A2Y18_01830 [Clostridiales bacterium GWD2_32_19]HCC06757.1 hypothetical protein [Clostridiales bacterium]